MSNLKKKQRSYRPFKWIDYSNGGEVIMYSHFWQCGCAHKFIPLNNAHAASSYVDDFVEAAE